MKADLKELARIENELVEENERLEALLTHEKTEHETLARAREERNGLLAKLEAEMGDKKAQLKGLKEDEQSLHELVASIQRAMDDFTFDPGPSKPFAELKGHLAWPVKGKIVKRFSAESASSRRDGVLIEADEGVDVYAVSHGRIAYADWLRGYGLLTIIDHGNGYMTLYAFNQSLYKAVGDRVEAGDVIASVGKSGGRAQTGLYFGIRKGGEPENPVSWCRKERNR